MPLYDLLGSLGLSNCKHKRVLTTHTGLVIINVSMPASAAAVICNAGPKGFLVLSP